MDTQKLTALVEKVAELRGRNKDMKSTSDMAMEKVENLPEYQEFEKTCLDVAELATDLADAEIELKSATLAVYERTGEKKPIDKVEVKIFKRLEYDLAEALAWCRTNAPSLLVVNKKPFEKTAVEIGAPVKVKEEAKCTIGSDLSCYLKKEVKPLQVKEDLKTEGEEGLPF